METDTKTETVKAKKTLFGNAKEVKTSASKDKHEEVVLKESDYPNISAKLKEKFDLKDQIEELKAKEEMLSGEIKEAAKEEFLKLYASKQRNPDSFKVRGELGGCAMIIPQDNYIKIKDEARAEEINKEFGDVVETNTEISFDAEKLAKYEQVISDLIENCPLIAEDDKALLFKKKVTWNVKKGTIDLLFSKWSNNMKEAMKAFQPIFQLKNCK